MADKSYGTVARLKEVVEKSGERLGKALRALDYPNGGRAQGIFHENNLIIHLAHQLMEKEFHCYAEAAVVDGQIDLLAYRDGIAFAVEAKMFGDPRQRVWEVMSDLARLETFTPLFSPPSDQPSAGHLPQWWASARERWGVVVIGYQRAGSREIGEAWTAHSDEVASDLIHKGNQARHRKETVDVISQRIVELRKDLRLRNAQTGACPICTGTHWQGADDAWLLWAVFPLSQHEQSDADA